MRNPASKQLSPNHTDLPRFFEWDALLVRDAVYELAHSLVNHGGSDQDISVCLQAMDDMRWALSQSAERIATIRQRWAETRGVPLAASTAYPVQGWNNPSESPRTSSSTSRVSMSSLPNLPPFSTATSTGTTGPSTMFASPEGSPDLMSSAQFHAYSGAPGSGTDGNGMAEKWGGADMSQGGSQMPYTAYQEHGLPGPGPTGTSAFGGADQAGRYVLQPDGRHIFVPYHGMP